jgi:hypothetical protein
MWIFMKDFANILILLTRLLQKDAPFQFLKDEIAVQNALKVLLINSLALQQIDYVCGRQCIMDVDSSFRGAGYVLFQLGENGKEYPSRFGQIVLKETSA